MRRGILGIVGATIERAARTPCSKRPISISPRIDHLNRRLAGQQISAIDRLGKRVVIVVQSQDRLILEPRMTGLVLLHDPPTREHLRFALDLSNAPVDRLLFWDRRGLGKVTLLSSGEYDAKLSDGSLGPDALEIEPEQFRDRLRTSRREIKVALLDQSALAGVGNLYASEILHLAGVHPQARCDRLSRSQWSLIFECMVEILENAIRYEGSTLSDGTYRNALNEAGGFQNEHRVYDRAGEACTFCSRTIVRIVQAQRATFYCKGCQFKKGTRRPV